MKTSPSSRLAHRRPITSPATLGGGNKRGDR